jgi:hypothetical protein
MDSLKMDSVTQYVDESTMYPGFIPDKKIGQSTKGAIGLGNNVLRGWSSTI